MAGIWLSLPSGWKLQDVQAALNVVVTVLSTLAIFTFVRYCWRRSARRLADGNPISLQALLSLNTLGEAVDVVLMYKWRLFRGKHTRLCLQCIMVCCLSVTALLSGPIARYSTRRGTVVHQKDAHGFLASRAHNGMGYANVEWNLTYSRLDKAGFPLDQLIDYLPSNSIDWIYEPSQWNNIWRLDCTGTPKTFITVNATGNCTRLRDELPGLDQAFSLTAFENYYQSWDGFYNSSTTNKDILLFMYAFTESDYAESQDTYLTIDFVLASIHMNGVPRPPQDQNSSTECDFGTGPIDHTSFTKIECTLTRKPSLSGSEYYSIAFPDVFTPASLPYAYTAYYQARFTQESTSDSPITTIQPNDLIRFYQTYTIVKDLQYRQPVSRQLSVQVSVVQISIVFLAFATTIALLILVGLADYAVFTFIHWHVATKTPQSKIDWMVHSIDARAQYSATSSSNHSSPSLAYDEGGDKRHRLEQATFALDRSTSTRSSWLERKTSVRTYVVGSPAADGPCECGYDGSNGYQKVAVTQREFR